MVRCIAANLLSDKYGVTCQPEEVYRPAQNWRLLVTASHTHSLVRPDSLRSCLESLRGQNHIDPADEKGPGRQDKIPGALRLNLVD